ncbi:Uncharacterised protein [Salmonella enterica subsp. arizonae]|nr:Uncharacterised protein [Salmonella enterica subsp. arizonae]
MIAACQFRQRFPLFTMLILRQGFQLIAKAVTDMARLSARQRSLAAGAELCTPMSCHPLSVSNNSGEPLSPGNVSHWCESTAFCAQPVTTQS